MRITDYAKTLSAIRLASLTSENLSDFRAVFDGALAAIGSATQANAPIEFAALSATPKKKNCTKGVYCIGKTGKGSCVKAGSKCKAKANKSSVDYTKAIGSEAPANFGDIEDKAAFKKLFQEWAPGIKELNALVAKGIAEKDLIKAQQGLQKAENDAFKPVRIFDYDTSSYRTINTQAELVKLYQGKLSQAQKDLKSAEKRVKRSPSVDTERLAAATTIYGDLKESLKDKRNTAAAVVGEDGKAKAMYTYRPDDAKKSLYLDFLVASPDSMLGDKSGKGAGTEAIKQLVRKSIKSGYGGKIDLLALDDAIPFYRKLGFEGEGDTLTLTPEKARQLIDG